MNINNYYIGLMSGTSVDSVDGVIAAFGENSVRLISTHSINIPIKIKQTLLKLNETQSCTFEQLGLLDNSLGEMFAECVQQLLQEAKINPNDIIAIGSHGQNIYHNPHIPFTMQIGNPHLIAKKTGILTISDFRRKDMVSGGQGAPFAPLFHQWLFASHANIILNIGGIANITLLSSIDEPSIKGFDTGPGNGLMDLWVQKEFNIEMDKNGDIARRGKIIPTLINALLNDPYFQKVPPKSTGKEYFNQQWLEKKCMGSEIALEKFKPEDVQATLLELTAISISDAIKKLTKQKKGKILLCGGGAHNTYLCERLAHHLGALFQFESTEKYGLHPNWVEAACFAWYAKNRVENQALDLCTITGATSRSVLGALYSPD